MKRYSLLFAIIIAGLLTGAPLMATTTSTHLQKQNKEARKNKESRGQEKLQRQAKVTMDQARETALKRAPGKVESSELEREHGQLVYSFDIRNAKGTITEVQVNAITGKIVRVEHENKKQEAAEKRKENRKTP